MMAYATKALYQDVFFFRHLQERQTSSGGGGIMKACWFGELSSTVSDQLLPDTNSNPQILRIFTYAYFHDVHSVA